MAAGAVGTARVINLLRGHSIAPALELYFLTCSRQTRRRSTSARVNTDSTSVYRLSALCTRPIGPGKKTKHAICASDISAQAQAALRHWSPPSTFHAKSQWLFPVVDVPI